MSAVEVTISGVIYDKTARTSRPVVIIGEATLTDLSVGGGPIIPPSGGGGGEHPAFPIAGPGPFPPKPGYPPYPAHPIVLPPDHPTDPPTEPPTHPADPAWEWAWNPNTGWIPAFVPGDKPRPPQSPLSSQPPKK